MRKNANRFMALAMSALLLGGVVSCAPAAVGQNKAASAVAVDMEVEPQDVSIVAKDVQTLTEVLSAAVDVEMMTTTINIQPGQQVVYSFKYTNNTGEDVVLASLSSYYTTTEGGGFFGIISLDENGKNLGETIPAGESATYAIAGVVPETWTSSDNLTIIALFAGSTVGYSAWCGIGEAGVDTNAEPMVGEDIPEVETKFGDQAIFGEDNYEYVDISDEMECTFVAKSEIKNNASVPMTISFTNNSQLPMVVTDAGIYYLNAIEFKKSQEFWANFDNDNPPEKLGYDWETYFDLTDVHGNKVVGQMLQPGESITINQVVKIDDKWNEVTENADGPRFGWIEAYIQMEDANFDPDTSADYITSYNNVVLNPDYGINQENMDDKFHITVDENVVKNVLSDAQVANGAKVLIEAKSLKDSEVSKEDAAALKAATSGTIIANTDLTVNNFQNATKNKIANTNGKVRFTMDIPKEYQNGTLEIVRVHEGKAEVLKDLDDDPETVTYESDLFSLYSLAYIAKKDNSPKTGDAAPVAAMVIVMILSASAGIIMKKQDRF